MTLLAWVAAFLLAMPSPAASPAARTEPAPAAASAVAGAVTKLEFMPEIAFIRGVGGSHTLLVMASYADGSDRDVTAQAVLEIDDPAVAGQTEPGLFVGHREGIAKLKATLGGQTAEAALLVQPKRDDKIDFVSQVAPLFSRHGCNNTNCHGALNGQNGFKLSLFGYDPDADWDAIVKASDGRRLNLAQPAQSPLLQKPTFEIAHGGGVLFAKDSLAYQTLLKWIESGAAKSAGDIPRLTRIDILPKGFRTLYGAGAQQQLVVVGYYTDGSRADLTRQVGYTSADEDIAAISPEGRITAKRQGEVNMLIRTLGHVSAVRVGVASEVSVPKLEVEPANFIDELVFTKLRRMNIEISGRSTDAEFVRRAYLDVIGMVPTAEEARSFLEDPSPGKRARLIDGLLQRPEYGDFWAAKWGDLFASNVLTSSDATAYLQDWLRTAFAENKPYDKFVKEVLTSTGSSWEVGAVSYFSRSTEDIVTLTGQAFLGLSLECARCHDHPSAQWKREDFIRMAAFFPQLEGKGLRPPPGESIRYLDYSKEFRHPETKQVVKPRFLDGAEPLIRPLQDRREVLADWIVSPKNPWFARATVNRFWNQFMGRPLVDPVDDFRSSNPPTNQQLLDRLAEDFVAHGYDLHHLIRRIMNSRTYQLSSAPTPTNRVDQINFSRSYLRRLTAEQLMDSLGQITGIPQDYLGYYPGVRAVNLADPGVPSSFLDMFDRPKREAARCERTESVSLRQAMHMLVGETVNEKLKQSAAHGTLSGLLKQNLGDAEIIEHYFLAALSRQPTPQEKDYCLTVIGKADSREHGLTNALWAVLNTNEFLYNH